MSSKQLEKVMPILQQFGISPDQLNPDDLNEMIDLCSNITNSNQINKKMVKKMRQILSIRTPEKKVNKPKISVRIKRNEPCICESGKKYKHCCMNN